METAFYGSTAQAFDTRPTQLLEGGLVPTMAAGLEACPESRTKTLPYMSFEPPVAAHTAQKAAVAVVRAPSSRPPFAVAFMLLVAVMMLVASGGFAVGALLEMV